MEKFSSYVKLYGTIALLGFILIIGLNYEYYYYSYINTKTVGRKFAYCKMQNRYFPALYSPDKKHVITIINTKNREQEDSILPFAEFHDDTKNNLPIYKVPIFLPVKIIRYDKIDTILCAKIIVEHYEIKRSHIERVGYIPIQFLHDTIPADTTNSEIW